MTACDRPRDERCPECLRADAGDVTSPDAAASADAAWTDAALGDAARLSDAGPSDTSVEAGDAAGALADAEAAAPEPVYAECRRKEDCVLPEGVLACQRCADGGMACPELSCVDRLCVFTLAKPCAEQGRGPACSKDAECEALPCDLLCQGDGERACREQRCVEGHCLTTYWTCGLHGNRCPDLTRAGQECLACPDGGACTTRVLGCFDQCQTAKDCPGEVACEDGLCQLLSCQ